MSDNESAPASRQLINEPTQTLSLMFKRLDDGTWFCESPSQPGCWGEGPTKDAAVEDYTAALREWAS